MATSARSPAAPGSLCAHGAPTSSPAEPQPAGMASYKDPEPDRFMRQWLVCGPFPVRAPAGKAVDEAVRGAAFARDFLEEHGGEIKVQPTPGLAHRAEGAEYAWRCCIGNQDVIDLDAVYGRHTNVVVYAAAEIEMSVPRTLLLGIGADDTVKVWLNGELIHEDWGPGPVIVDQRLVLAPLRRGKNRLLLKVINGDGPWGFACRPLGLRADSANRLLLRVATEGQEKVADYLLRHAARVDAHDTDGWTPLHHAAYNGRQSMVELLLAKGADVDSPSVDHLTPLHLARRGGFKELAAFLVDTGRARGYTPDGGGYRLNDYRQLTVGDGGIYATVEDLFRWDQCLYTEQLVSRATLQEAFTPGRTRDGKEVGYGFGWQLWEFRGLNAVSHSGGNSGFRANILRIPSERFTVVFLSNNSAVRPHTMSERIAEIYLWPRMAPRRMGG